ncbi:hypothetical protein RFI_30503, partial [Reticulomyxa filosa]
FFFFWYICLHNDSLVTNIEIPQSAVRWPTETPLQIGCLHVETHKLDQLFWRNTVRLIAKEWKEFLSTTNQGIQLCLIDTIVYDLTEHSSFVSLTDPHASDSLRGHPALNIRLAAELWNMKDSITMPRSNCANSLAKASSERSLALKESLFRKIVDVMHIDDSKLKEYNDWFEIDLAQWIHCNVKKIFFQRNKLKTCFAKSFLYAICFG